MANIADTLYRVYGSKETLDLISEKVKVGMCHRDALNALGYLQPDVTEELAKSILLFDYYIPTYGIKRRYEHLNNFMEEHQIPYGTPLEEVNKALEECSIMSVTTDGLYMRGTIQYIEKSESGFVDIQSDDAWSEQQDFITALKERFKDDEEFSIDFRCEEPGCDYYVSNVAGAIYGEYVSDIDCETEYHETFEEMSAYVLEWLCKIAKGTSFPKCENFEELQEFCDKYNETNPDHPIFVHQFTILS